MIGLILLKIKFHILSRSCGYSVFDQLLSTQTATITFNDCLGACWTHSSWFYKIE